MARDAALRCGLRGRQRRGFAHDGRRMVTRSAPERRARQRGGDIRNERRAARDDRGTGRGAGRDRVARGVRLSRRSASPLLPLLAPALPGAKLDGRRAAPGSSTCCRARQRFCCSPCTPGLDDFFVATWWPSPRTAASRAARGQPARADGIDRVHRRARGRRSERPRRPGARDRNAFGARIAVFGLVALDQSLPSIDLALVFGATFLAAAPLTVPSCARASAPGTWAR